MLSPQLQAEQSHVLKLIVFELGGLAHDHMSLQELDSIIDSILSKGIPTTLSPALTRWIRAHCKKPEFKIQQILRTTMSDKHSLVPDCFARFHDGTAVECKVCLDRVECKAKCTHNGSAEVMVPAERVHVVYPLGKRADVDDLREVLSQKTGQIARTLSQGNKVVLVVSHNQLQVLALESTPSQEDTIMSKKPDTKAKKTVEEDDEEDEVITKTPAKAAAKDLKPVKKAAKPVVEEDDEEDEDLDLEEVDEEGDEDEDEEEEAPKKSKKTTKAEPEPKAKKEKKAAPALNTLQAEFVDKLKTTYKENEALFKAAKKAGVKWDRKDDPRIDRMLCVMSMKKFLGEQGKSAAKAKK